MIKKILIAALLLVLLTQCNKEKEASINVTDIYQTDMSGTLMAGSFSDNQWKSMSFSEDEKKLFSIFDTVDLAGTKLPSIQQVYYGYPNPFTNNFNLPVLLTEPLDDDLVVKYVVVDDKMKVMQKGCTRIYVSGTVINFLINTQFSPGNYRVYFTYSAEGNPDFFTSWGNLQKSKY